MDWREMFIKYANVVGDREGVYFLHAEDWTPEEWAAIQEAMAGSIGWPDA